MKRHPTKEGREIKTLQEIGLGQDVPAGEFSDQPDSGSRIGGIRGAQEYGIEGGIAAESGSEIAGGVSVEGRLIDQVNAASASIEEFSSEAEEEIDESELAEELEEEETLAERDLLADIEAAGLPEDGAVVDPEGFKLFQDLKALIEYRLNSHDRIDARNFRINVQGEGMVIITGRARSESESLRVSEIISALPGVYAINNRLVVPR
jgi:hypothetical protein